MLFIGFCMEIFLMICKFYLFAYAYFEVVLRFLRKCPYPMFVLSYVCPYPMSVLSYVCLSYVCLSYVCLSCVCPVLGLS